MMHQVWFLEMTGNQLLAGLLFTALGVCASPFFNDLYEWAKGRVLAPRETRRMREGVAGVSAATSAGWGFLAGAAVVGLVVFALFVALVAGLVIYRYATRTRPSPPAARLIADGDGPDQATAIAEGKEVVPQESGGRAGR